MASPQVKLAQALNVLKKLQGQGIVAIKSDQLTRSVKERLLKNGFLKEVMRGWYICSRPDEPIGESTAWYTSFWGFCADYCNARFGKEWCLTPEQSISLHVGNLTVPKQLLIRSPKGGNKPTKLLHDTSIFDARLNPPSKEDIVELEGLRAMSIPAALIACTPRQYTANPLDIRAAFSTITDVTDILRKLLEGNHTTIAGRIAGAFINIGRNDLAETIVETMNGIGHEISLVDPFKEQPPIEFGQKESSPTVNRLKLLWMKHREIIIEHFPEAPASITETDTYLNQLDELYTSDAYHSLSIEGYRVSEELINKVKDGNWSPDTSNEDREHRNALAARGYWEAFQAVKESIKKVLNQEDPGQVGRKDHPAWYRALFTPSVAAGIIKASDLAGYRNQAVYIRQSMHTPPKWDAVRELIPTLFELIENEEHPAVRIVLGHFIFVYIHPYMDGNGRTGRFLMNVMMAAGGYPWTIIPVEQRTEYMQALESASVNENILPFTQFLANLIASTKTKT